MTESVLGKEKVGIGYSTGKQDSGSVNCLFYAFNDIVDICIVLHALPKGVLQIRLRFIFFQKGVESEARKNVDRRIAVSSLDSVYCFKCEILYSVLVASLRTSTRNINNFLTDQLIVDWVLRVPPHWLSGRHLLHVLFMEVMGEEWQDYRCVDAIGNPYSPRGPPAATFHIAVLSARMTAHIPLVSFTYFDLVLLPPIEDHLKLLLSACSEKH
ncbi:unnamed protein product [Angiostrongylus costaricensis]|uniref:Uncharacterized protein n=1 Tax=Angiostrongylus costaricensis TaxID=334426 RepID=A0A0R3PGY6_ANGCS|nr:unnamed protein product [Angiostrongylus costaricensis]